MRKRFHPAFVAIPVILILIFGVFWPRSQNLGQFKDATAPYALGDTNFTLGEVSEWVFDSLAFWRNDGTADEQRAFVQEYFLLLEERKTLDRAIEHGETDSEALAHRATLVAKLDTRRARVERIMEAQVSWAIMELGIRRYSILPPVEVQFHEDPTLLVISSREAISDVRRIYLIDNLTLAEKEALEAQIDAMGYSAIVVRLGGRSTFPATVRPQDIRLTLKTIAHEWVHHYRNLKNLRDTTHDSESRAIEETIAGLLDRAIGDLAYTHFYDSKYTRPEQKPSAASEQFDATAEMRTTYERAVELLEQGHVDEAEAYMDDRRDFFEENGQFIRKINQAWFVFKGSYAADTAFAAANDGVGEKLQRIFDHFENPADFLKHVLNIKNMQQLDKLLKELGLDK